MDWVDLEYIRTHRFQPCRSSILVCDASCYVMLFKSDTIVSENSEVASQSCPCLISRVDMDVYGCLVPKLGLSNIYSLHNTCSIVNVPVVSLHNIRVNLLACFSFAIFRNFTCKSGLLLAVSQSKKLIMLHLSCSGLRNCNRSGTTSLSLF